MKVLIVYHAGAMLNARQLYQALIRNGKIELAVIVPQRLQIDRIYDPSGWLCVEREEQNSGYRLIPVPLRDSSNCGKGFAVKPLHLLLKQMQPDVIHVLDEATSNSLSQVVWQGFIASPRSKVLFYGFENLPIRLGWRVVLWKLTWPRIAGGATASSEALENLRHVGFPENRPLERIFWGISQDTFRVMDKRALKRELGLDCEYIVGFVGRFLPQKGLNVLQAAMQHLPAAVHCVAIGDGLLREELILWSTLPAVSGRVHLYDVMPPETLAKYLNCMDVLVVPSLTQPHWKEQYGRVIAEAMGCGVPVVGSDSGAIPEVIGSAGLVVPEGDSEALAEAVQKVLFERDVGDHCRQQGLRRVQQELSIDGMAQRFLKFYRHVLET